MNPRALRLLPFCLLAACGGLDLETPVILGAFPEQPITTSRPTNVEVDFGGRYDNHCGGVSSQATLTINGEPLEFISRGGREQSLEGMLGMACGGPYASGFVQPGADGVDRILLQDGRVKVLDAEVAGLLAERRLELLSPRDGVLKAGMDVVLQWVPATDMLEFSPGSLHTGDPVVPALDFLSDDRLSSGLSNHIRWPIIQEGSIIRFHLKSAPSTPASGRLVVRPDKVFPRVLRCEGSYRNCQAVVHGWVRISLPVTFGGN